jgi:hypothetical protein
MEKFRSGISALRKFMNRLVCGRTAILSVAALAYRIALRGTTGFRIANGREGHSLQKFLVLDRTRPSDRDGASCLASRMFIAIERAI